MNTSLRCALYAVVTVVAAASNLQAQQSPRGSSFATRAELEALASESARLAIDVTRNSKERDASQRAANSYRERLRIGDFRVGDRVLVRFSAPQTSPETLTVTAARTITLPEVGDVALDGILRSELQQHLSSQLARAFRTPDLRAEPLVRMGVLGEARLPGFVYVASHALLSDVITAAGGLTANGDLSRAIVRRAGTTLMPRDAFSRAIAAGSTLDDLDIRAGDEIFIEPAKTRSWTQIIQTAVVVFGAAMTYVAVQSRH